MKKKIVSKRSARKPPEDRRSTILDATLRLIATEGVDSITHRRVATAADVPLGSTTYYFESREQLLREAFRLYLTRIWALQTQLLESFRISSAESLVNYLVELTKRTFEDEAMMLAEYELTLFAARDSEVADALHEWDAAMIAELARALEKLGCARPFDAAKTLLHMMRGHELDSLSRHDADSEDLRRRLRVVVAALVGESVAVPKGRGKRAPPR
jgi:TetR/AcrR family transcriptional regulator, regulator of biofilm formation and stress response